ncbi:mucin-2-like isoform X1 [Tachysurus fulvidraco]|uniref:mucin-2-like isoform X1 n=1 Tax=Tachysurus fulvidraco TaxID=1234273 RepID=UPI001FEF4645|nr:mucin-2-like isoform X1 [Tachysurus fulvidraco]
MAWSMSTLCALALALTCGLQVNTAWVHQSNHVGSICSMWGNFHFKMFDGDVYQFQGTCEYNLVSDCHGPVQGFSVHVKRSGTPGISKITRVLVTIGGIAFELTKNIVMVNNDIVKLPHYVAGVLLEENSIYIKLYAKLGLSVTWNKDDAVMLELDSKYANRTCGLCGDYNGAPVVNEFLSDGYVIGFTEFANRHRIHSPIEDCEDPYEEFENEDKSVDKCQLFREDCSELLLDESWSFCRNVLSPEPYIQSCMLDTCASGPGDTDDSTFFCSTLSEYSRQCSHAGGKPPNWRTPTFCAMTCPFNMEYSESGSPCLDTCTNTDTSSLCAEHKMDGCFCPPGTVFDDISERGCIPQEQCQCKHIKVYNTGEVLLKNDEECVCQQGRWICESLLLPGVCAIEEGSHFTTFDGKEFTFHGRCSYVLSKDCVDSKFIILGQLIPCVYHHTDTCLKSIVLILNNDKNNAILIKDDGIIRHNGDIKLPYTTADFTIFRPSSFYIMLQTTFGLHLYVQLVPVMQLYITLDQSFQANTCGLCGNFNKVLYDELMTPQGVVEGTATSFANSWKAQSNCPDQIERLDDPCSYSIDSESYAEHWCSKLKDKEVFGECHSTVNPESYYKRCKYSSCTCEKSEDCLCAVFSSYVRACRAKGVFLKSWRDTVCEKYTESCPATQTFSYNVQQCQQTCDSLSLERQGCSTDYVPVDGCACPAGLYESVNGVCVTMDKCPCYHNGEYFKPGKSINIKNDHCICTNGKLQCQSWRSRMTGCPAPKVFFNCSTAGPDEHGIECAQTCAQKNVDCYPTGCESGCKCPEDLLDDGRGFCVKEHDCPCKHDNHFYAPGSEITEECNKCICKRGEWDCTKNKCPGTCTIYGSGHYNTFDKQRFGFGGYCSYIALQNNCGNQTKTFHVITENVPCGTTGTTCSKAVRVILGRTVLELRDGKMTEKKAETGLSIKFNVRYVGLYLVIDSEIGLTVLWDFKTTVRIILQPYHMGEVCGLCGNFNGNGQDDFTTQDSLQVSDVLEFVNSWKLDSSCPNANPDFDPCTQAQNRHNWAKLQCSIIKSDTFKECHDKVEWTPYYENCVKDSCACDTGGDCECFCTAVAAYAQACNEAKVCVAWRTPEICPVFCDYYNHLNECIWHYSPCETPCYKTCLNPTGICTNPLPHLEGCYPKCPEDKPIFDEKNQVCVEECPGCFINGTEYTPGEEIPTKIPCNFCYCHENGSEICFLRPGCCFYNGTEYNDNDVIYNVTDNMGTCYYAICINNTVNNGSYPCEGYITPTTTEISTVTTPAPTTTPVYTTATVTTTVTHPTTMSSTTVSESTECIICEWTTWINVYDPVTGGWDDLETYENIKNSEHKICKQPEDIECRNVQNPDMSLEDFVQSTGQVVQCNVSFGLVCEKRQQTVRPYKCFDYEIRVLCCGECGTTTSPGTVTTTPSTTSITTAETSTTPKTVPTSTTGKTTKPTTTPLTTTESTTSQQTVTTSPSTTSTTTPETSTTPKTVPTSTTGKTTKPTTSPLTTTESTTSQQTVTTTPSTISITTAETSTTPKTVPTSTTGKTTKPTTTPLTTTESTTSQQTVTTSPSTISTTTAETSTTPVTVPTSTTGKTTKPTTTPLTTTESTTSQQTVTTSPSTISITTAETSTTPKTVPTSTTGKTTKPTTTPLTAPESTTSQQTVTTSPSTISITTAETSTTPKTVPTSTTGKTTKPTTTPLTAPESTTSQQTVTTSPSTISITTAETSTTPKTVPTSTTGKTTKPTTTPLTTTESTTSQQTVTTSPSTISTTTAETSTTPETVPTSTTGKTNKPTTTLLTTTESTTSQQTVTTVTHPTTMSSTTVSESTECIICEWTTWINVYDPVTGGWDDLETYENIMNSGHKICKQPEDIKCRNVQNPDMSLEDFVQSTGQVVQCNVSFGLVCEKRQQTVRPYKCFDYEIRVLCCGECGTTTSPGTVTTTPSTISITTAETSTTPKTVPTSTTGKTTKPTTTPLTTTESTTSQQTVTTSPSTISTTTAETSTTPKTVPTSSSGTTTKPATTTDITAVTGPTPTKSPQHNLTTTPESEQTSTTEKPTKPTTSHTVTTTLPTVSTTTAETSTTPKTVPTSTTGKTTKPTTTPLTTTESTTSQQTVTTSPSTISITTAETSTTPKTVPTSTIGKTTKPTTTPSTTTESTTSQQTVTTSPSTISITTAETSTTPKTVPTSTTGKTTKPRTTPLTTTESTTSQQTVTTTPSTISTTTAETSTTPKTVPTSTTGKTTKPTTTPLTTTESTTSQQTVTPSPSTISITTAETSTTPKTVPTSTTGKTTKPTTTPLTTTESTTSQQTVTTSPSTISTKTAETSTTPKTVPTSTTGKTTKPRTTPLTTTESTTSQQTVTTSPSTISITTAETSTTPKTVPTSTTGKTTKPTTTPLTTTESTTSQQTVTTSPSTISTTTAETSTTPKTVPTSTTGKTTKPTTTPLTTTESTTSQQTVTTSPSTTSITTAETSTTPKTVPTSTTGKTTKPTTTPLTTTESTTSQQTVTTSPSTISTKTAETSTTPKTVPTSTTGKTTKPTTTPLTAPESTTSQQTVTTSPSTISITTAETSTTPKTVPTSTTGKTTKPTTTPLTTTESTTSQQTVTTSPSTISTTTAETSTTPKTVPTSTTGKTTKPTTTPLTTTESTTSQQTVTTSPSTTSITTAETSTTPKTVPTSTTGKTTKPTTTPLTTTESTTSQQTVTTSPSTISTKTAETSTTPKTVPTSTTGKTTKPTTTPLTTTQSTTSQQTVTTSPSTISTKTAETSTTPKTVPTSTTGKTTKPTTTPLTTTESTTSQQTVTTSPSTISTKTAETSTTPKTVPTSTTGKTTKPTTTPLTTTESTTSQQTVTTSPSTISITTAETSTTPKTVPTSTTGKTTKPTTTPLTTTESTTSQQTVTTSPSTISTTTAETSTTPKTVPTSTTGKTTKPTTTPLTTTESTTSQQTVTTTPSTISTTTAETSTTPETVPTSTTGKTTKPTTTPVVSTTPTSIPTTTECFCIINGVQYEPGKPIFEDKDIGSGVCLSMFCSDSCLILNTTRPCPTTATPTPTPPPKNCTEWGVEENEIFEICNCTLARCIENNTVEIIPYECPPLQNITCSNGKQPVLVPDEYHCCEQYACDCFCEGWGDPHYITFDGRFYSHQGECTYVLMEEISHKHHLKIYIDNVNCDPRESVSCPRSIIVSYHNRAITLKNHNLLGAAKLEALMGNSSLKLPFEEKGLRVMSSGLTLILQIPKLNVVVMFGVTGFSVNLPFEYFGNNTQGHCGTCNNNKADDCRLPDGKLVDDCAVMANSWQATDLNNPDCKPPPVEPETVAPTKAPCPINAVCELLKSDLFKECHPHVSPQNYFSGCQFDSCHMSNPTAVCTSARTYAVACSQAGVCINWRDHTDICTAKCPADKIYLPCGPADPPTCKDKPDDQFMNVTTEGCFCPNGTKLFSKESEVCVDKCGCLDPDGQGREFGEKFQYGCQDCVCDESSVSINCKPRQCSNDSNQLTCSDPGFIVANVTDPSDACCTILTCSCESSTCPSVNAKCSPGYTPVFKVPEGKCCAEYTCEPKSVCVHKGLEYEPGTSIPVIDCQECRCTQDVDPNTQLYRVQCGMVTCNEQCGPGYSYVESDTKECCGKCVKTKCVLNYNGTVQILENGAEWTPSNDACDKFVCIMTNGEYVTTNYKIQCPPFNISNCQPGTVQLSSNRCCQVCVDMDSGCKVQTSFDYITHDNCRSKTTVEQTHCEGHCDSYSKYTELGSSTCSCCQASRTSKQTVSLDCENGDTINHTYLHVEACSCDQTKCLGKSQSTPTHTEDTRRRRSFRLP